jgi:molecular chaperone HscB
MDAAKLNHEQTHAVAAAGCWSCTAPAGEGHFCVSCGKILPLACGADFFQIFGLPRKLWLEMDALEAKFHELSWKLHPDNFVRASENERELSLDRSSQLNDAYRALRDPVTRVEYLLQIEGKRKEGTTKQQAPPELLEEVFELNESLDELRAARKSGGDGAGMASLRERLQGAETHFGEKLEEVDASLMQSAREWDAALDSGMDSDRRSALLARLNEILNRRSYIRNLVNSVQKELAV